MKKKKNNSNLIFISLLIILAVAIVFLIIRYNTVSSKTLTCVKDLTEQYHETLIFRYDVDNNMYSYSREEIIHDMDEENLNNNYLYFAEQYKKFEGQYSDNFKYEVNREDNRVVINTYIGVSIYPKFFNDYIKNDNIKSSTRINDVKSFLETNSYKCEIGK